MKKLVLTVTLVALWASKVGHAAEFFCSSGNATCLVAAINAANQNGEDNSIDLEAGDYTLTTVDNNTEGPNGLPSITGKITIQGPPGTGSTIEREVEAADLRLFHVSEGGTLNLSWLGIRNGFVFREGGGAILNRGTLTIHRSAIYDNGTFAGSGGAVRSTGRLTITDTEIRSNSAFDGGGISAVSLFMAGSFVFGNSAEVAAAGILMGGGSISRSSIYGNRSIFASGGLFVAGTVIR